MAGVVNPSQIWFDVFDDDDEASQDASAVAGVQPTAPQPQRQPQPATSLALSAGSGRVPSAGGQQAGGLSAAALETLQDRRAPAVGPDLRAVLEAQEARGVREVYSLQHLKRLMQYEARGPLLIPRRHKLCKQMHNADCTQCVSCHFCRWGVGGSTV